MAKFDVDGSGELEFGACMPTTLISSFLNAFERAFVLAVFGTP